MFAFKMSNSYVLLLLLLPTPPPPPVAEAAAVSEIRYDVCVEPELQRLSGESFTNKSEC